MARRDIIRRDVLKLTAAGGAAATIGRAQAQTKTIVFNDSGGASKDAADAAFGAPFLKENNIAVRVTAPANIARLKAMVEAGNVEWDVAELVSQEHRVAIREKLLEPLDKSVISFDGLLPEAVDDYAVCFAYYATAMAYRADRVAADKVPKNWAEFWDVAKFPGRRTLRNHPVDNLEFALLADGVPKDKLYPLDINRAFRSLDKIKPHVAVWWKDGAQPAQLLQDGEVDFATSWTGRFYNLFVAGERRVKVSWAEAAAKMSWVGVPRGSRNKAEAMKLIALMMRPEAGAEYAKRISYVSANPKVIDLLPAETREWTATAPANRALMFVQNEDWWLDNLQAAQDRWNGWITA